MTDKLSWGTSEKLFDHDFAQRVETNALRRELEALRGELRARDAALEALCTAVDEFFVWWRSSEPPRDAFARLTNALSRARAVQRT